MNGLLRLCGIQQQAVQARLQADRGFPIQFSTSSTDIQYVFRDIEAARRRVGHKQPPANTPPNEFDQLVQGYRARAPDIEYAFTSFVGERLENAFTTSSTWT